MGKTLAEKLWDSHVVRSAAGEPDLLYIDMHLVHEVTSPQAFDGLRLAGRPVRRPDLTLATEDHNVPDRLRRCRSSAPSRSRTRSAAPRSRRCARNCAEFGVRLYPMGDAEQGIVHVIGPQLGHHPAGHDDRLRRLAHLDARRVRRAGLRHRHQPGRARARHPDAADGPAQDDGGHRRRRRCRDGVTPKDVILAVIAKTGTGGGQGYMVEYRGSAFEQMSMEGRMTVCNMSIEWGARAGMIAPDETTFDYLEGPRPRADRRRLGRRRRVLDAACAPTTTPSSTPRSPSTRATLTPFVTWGTNPGQGAPLRGARARPGRLRRRAPTASPPRRRWPTWA